MFTTYKKRSGTADRGKEYEWLLCALYSLKFTLDDNVVDFEIYSNNLFFGDLDDVIVRVRDLDGKINVYLLQLKHSEKEKNLAVSSLVSENGPFSLFKYRKSYENMLHLDNFKFILFTNKVAKFKDNTKLKFGDQNVYLKREKCVGKGLLDTSKNRICSVFGFYVYSDSGYYSDQNKKFFERLYLYLNQQNDLNLKESISTILQVMVQCDIYSAFIEFIRGWWSGNFRLGKYDVVTKIAELVFSPMIRPLTTEKCNNETKLIKEAVMKADLTIIESDEECDIAKIWEETSNQTDVKRISLSALKYGLITKGINTISELTPKKLSIALWYLEEVPLVLEIDDFNRNQICSTLHLLEKYKKKKKIVFVGGLEYDFANWKLFSNLTDLPMSDDLRKRVVQNFRCSLQGKEPVTLESIGVYHHTDLAEIFSSSLLLKIAVNEKFNIGECLENLPPVYIPRSFPKILFGYSVIDKLKEKTMLSCKGHLEYVQRKCRKRIMTTKCHMKIENYQKYYVYGAEEDFSKEDFEYNSQRGKLPILHFRYLDNNNLQWLNSMNVNIKELEKYKKINTSECFSELEISNNLQSKICILISHTGGGKTCLLNKIKNQSPADCFVIKMNLKEHSQFFSQNRRDAELWTYLVTFYAESRNYNEFERHIVNKFLKDKVIVLWDGFDELHEDSRPCFIKCVKKFSEQRITQWITSKSNFKQFLEKTFDVFALTMSPLSEQQRSYYIQERSGITDCNVIDEFFNNITIIDNSEYLGIPLQLYILTDIFNQNPQVLKNILTLTDMCQYFIDGKYTHFLKKANYEVNLLDDIIQEGKEHRLQQYKIAALKTYLPEFASTLKGLQNSSKFVDNIRKGDFLGLIVKVTEDGCFEFEHNIFGQYLCALWLSENTNYLDPFLFEENNCSIKFMFDLILSEKHPIFISLLYKKFDSLPNCQIVKDKAGRSPLHVICTYGAKHALMSTESDISMSYHFSHELPEEKEENSSQVDSEDLKGAVNYLKTKCNLLEKDDLFKWTPYEYADRSLSLGLIEILGGPLNSILPTLHNYKDSATVLYHSTKQNYSNLFEVIKSAIYLEYEKGKNLLHITAEFGREKILAYLLEHETYNKFINKANSYKWTPIHFASFSGHLEILKELKEKGGTFRLADPSALSLATTKKYRDVIEYLLECDISPNDFYQTNYFTQSLPLAISRGYLDIVEFLVNNGAKIYAVGKNSMNAFHMALENEQMEVAKFLLTKGIKIDEVDGFCRNSCHHAAMSNQKSVIEFLLERGANFHALDKDRRSPLHYAAQNGSLEVVELLIQKGIAIDAQDDFGSTPLHLAAKYGQILILKTLIKAGCGMNFCDKIGRTAMHYAAFNGLVECIEILHQHGCSLEIEDTLYKRRPLHYAAWNGHDDCIDILIKKGAVIDAPCQFRYTPLHLAVESDNFESCKLLIEAGASVFAQKRSGSTPFDSINDANYALILLFLKCFENPLHVAVERMYDELIPELVALGYDINGVDKNGATPLHIAVTKPNALDLIKGLLMKGADVRIADLDGYIPLHYALQSQFVDRECVKALISADTYNETINKETKTGLTPLLIAAQAGFHLYYPRYNDESALELVQLLIDKGAILDVADKEGFTPLHFAARSGNLKIVELLLEKGMPIHEINKHGRTALHMAATQNNIPMVRYLLRKEASTTMPDDDGETALDDALRAEHPRVYIELIAQINFQDLLLLNRKGRTVLHMAAIQGQQDLVELFLDNNVPVDFRDNDGNTAVDHAFFCRHFDIFHLFISRGGSFDFNKYNTTYKRYPLHVAVLSDSIEMVEFVLQKGGKVSVVDEDGNTPLHNAVEKLSNDVAQILLNNDSSAIDMRNKSGQTALHIAVNLHDHNMVALLMKNGARTDLVDNDGNVPFDICFNKGSVFMMKELLITLDDFDVTKRNKANGATLLHYAEDIEVAEWLIKMKAPIDAVDDYGNTPLHAACERPEIAKLLLKKYGSSIDINAKNNRGETVLHLASASSLELVELILERGARLDVLTKTGLTPLDYALKSENISTFKFLLDRNPSADVLNMLSQTAKTPLHIAASKGDIDLVKLLLDRGAKINDVSRFDGTPLDCAMENGHLDVLDVLLEKDKKTTVVNKANSSGATMLHEAARDGKLDFAKLLVKKGARVDLRDGEGKTPAEVALEAEEMEVYQFLKEVTGEE